MPIGTYPNFLSVSLLSKVNSLLGPYQFPVRVFVESSGNDLIY
jgi:hypothetical protein